MESPTTKTHSHCRQIILVKSSLPGLPLPPPGTTQTNHQSILKLFFYSSPGHPPPLGTTPTNHLSILKLFLWKKKKKMYSSPRHRPSTPGFHEFLSPKERYVCSSMSNYIFKCCLVINNFLKRFILEAYIPS